MKQELVKNWMSTHLITISPATTLPEAHFLMRDHHIRRLPVVDEEGRLAGIVTLGDVREAEPSSATSLSIWEINYLLSKLKVEEIMTPHPYTIGQEATIGEAAQMMLQYKVGGLPVLDRQGRLAGIITESDIFRLVAQGWEKQGQAVEAVGQPL